MSDTIMIKSGALGNRAEMPKLSNSELGYLTDKKELYIGTSEGNKRLCGVEDIADTNTKIEEINTLITGINGDIANVIARLDALENTEE